MAIDTPDVQKEKIKMAVKAFDELLLGLDEVSEAQRVAFGEIGHEIELQKVATIKKEIEERY